MSVDELIPKAREIAAGGVTSKSGLQKALKVSWAKAVEVHQALTTEQDQARAGKAARRRELVARMGRRKGSGRGPTARRAALLPVPVSPAVEAAPAPAPVPAEVIAEGVGKGRAEPVVAPSGKPRKRVRTWPIIPLMFPATVAIWAGWVDLGRLTGFGIVRPFPGIPVLAAVELNTAITLPIGLETYAAYALYVWLSGLVGGRAKVFAMWSSIGSLSLGALGQVIYHLMAAAGWSHAPWPITTVVACIPVAVLGLGAALRHLAHADQE